MKTISPKTAFLPYVDANALAALVFDKGERSARVASLIEEGGTVSALSIDEFLWVARKTGHKEYSEIAHELLMHPTLEFIEVRCTTTLRASELMVKHNLKPRDAMHIAIMQEEGATTIISSDADFDRIPGITRISI